MKNQPLKKNFKEKWSLKLVENAEKDPINLLKRIYYPSNFRRIALFMYALGEMETL